MPGFSVPPHPAPSGPGPAKRQHRLAMTPCLMPPWTTASHGRFPAIRRGSPIGVTHRTAVLGAALFADPPWPVHVPNEPSACALIAGDVHAKWSRPLVRRGRSCCQGVGLGVVVGVDPV